MPSIPVQCMICDKTIKEDQFPRHMQMAHGTLSQSEAMAQAGNVSQQAPAAPVPLDKEAPPSSDFMEVAKMLDSAPTPPPAVTKEMRVSANTPQQVEVKPLVLKYKWEGSCKDCVTPVRTVVVKAKGQTVAVALCLTHGELEQREVDDLEKCEPLVTFKPSITEKALEDMVVEMDKGKEVKKKNGK